MNLDLALNALSVRLCDWSQARFYNEMACGCPLLSLVGLNNRRIAAFVVWSQTLSKDEQREFADSLVLFEHWYASQYRKIAITEKMRYWRKQIYEQTSARMPHLPPLATSDTAAASYRHIDPNACLDHVVRLSPPIFGKVVRSKSAVKCVHVIGDWKFITHFTFQRRAKDLDCTFQFIRKDDKHNYVVPELPGKDMFPRNIFSLFGVYNHTVVAVESEADAEPMAKALVKLAECLAEDAASLFSGLGIDD